MANGLSETPRRLNCRAIDYAEKTPSQLVDHFIAQGIENCASDIHAEPTVEGLRVRYRIDGVLQDVALLDSSLSSSVVARLKVLSDLLTYRTDIPQEGRIQSNKHGGAVDLRVSTFPTIHGEKAVVRIFDPKNKTFDLHSLGFPPHALETLQAHLSRPQAVVLLTGPSGSGKTTTLYSCINHILETSPIPRNIVTIEDPVEYGLPGVTQTQVNPPAGLTFATGLRSLLRQDPEVIMIGEIRDPETARIAIESGLTGHLVLSTIHTGTACNVFGRLLDMGVEPYLITSALDLVVAQRLVRALCPACKEQVPPRPSDPLAVRAGQVFEPRGCDHCSFLGYRGRRPLVEALAVSEEVRQALLSRADRQALQDAARKRGMQTLFDHAVSMVRDGLTSVSEIRRVLVV